jgi:hypothetical protein
MSLNNAGDEITLLDTTQAVRDVLAYMSRRRDDDSAAVTAKYGGGCSAIPVDTSLLNRPLANLARDLKI